MFSKLLHKFLIGLCFAIPFGILAATTAQAQETDPVTQKEECQDCHEVIHNDWSDSAHGQSLSDPVFVQAWEEKGSPDACLACHTTEFDPKTGTYEEDSVSCAVCHDPAPANHPDSIMFTSISSRMCGDCHLDSYAEWGDSVHGQENLSCARCHNAHSTELRADTVQELCESCHEDLVHSFTETAHADEGLMCADCHLSFSDTEMGEGHGQRDHTFTVELETCANCHNSESMHDSTVVAASLGSHQPITEADMSAEAEQLPLIPEPISPFGFAVIAALIGMGFGIVMAPWLESWYSRVR
jgi:hypothetical protein